MQWQTWLIAFRVNTSVANANADDKQTDNEEVEVVDKTEEEPQEEVQQAVEQVENERPTAVEQSTDQVTQTAETEPETQQSRFGQVSAIDAVNDEKDRTAPAAKKLPKAEGRQLAREYSMAKDSGEDSWQLFLDLARDYKMRDSRLATVYIDSNLKSVLDRLKSATSIKLPSTAILSAIVARFVFEHEKDIKNAIFGESLL